MRIVAFTQADDSFYFSISYENDPHSITLFTTTHQEIQFIPDANEESDGTVNEGGAKSLPNYIKAPHNCSIVCISRCGTYLIGEKTILRVRQESNDHVSIHLDKVTFTCPTPTVHTLDTVENPTVWERL